jgi:hypothetical protein
MIGIGGTLEGGANVRLSQLQERSHPQFMMMSAMTSGEPRLQHCSSEVPTPATPTTRLRGGIVGNCFMHRLAEAGWNSAASHAHILGPPDASNPLCSRSSQHVGVVYS